MRKPPCFFKDQLQEAPGGPARASPTPYLWPALPLLPFLCLPKDQNRILSPAQGTRGKAWRLEEEGGGAEVSGPGLCKDQPGQASRVPEGLTR